MKQNFYIKNIYSKFIEISGKDSTNFLQGLITNDINKCNKDNILIYSCILSPQGKFLADFFISKNQNYYLLEIHKKYFKSFYNKLEIYKLRSNVNFKEKTNLISFILFNKENMKFDQSAILFDDPRKKIIGNKIYLEKNSSNFKIINKFNEKNYEFYKEILIKNLIPNSVDDLIEGKSLLLENNFQNINPIDWNKGCYIGQEITARMKYRALLKKQIYVLKLLSGKINPGDNIIEQNINIGNVISKVGKYVLCMLKINLAKNKSLNKEQIIINSSTQLKFL